MILDDIIFNKRQEVARLKSRFNGKNPRELVRGLPEPRDFMRAFAKTKFSLIAEIKRASPSAGAITADLNPTTLAKEYEEGGASAISVLTDEKYFLGKLADLKAAKESTTIPILRKDFIIDELQVYESRIAGADAILLIARLFANGELAQLLKLTEELGMQALVEVHDAKDAVAALNTDARLIGINNRDLDTFAVDLNNSLSLLESYPGLKERIVISESGITSGKDVAFLKQAGVNGVLVGESILKAADVAAKIQELTQ